MTDDTNKDVEVSDDLIELFEAYHEASCKHMKERILLDFADQYNDEHDLSDSNVSEQIHTLVEEYQTAKLALEQAGLRLGRYTIDALREIVKLETPEEPKLDMN